jgi:alpha-galactosidase
VGRTAGTTPTCWRSATAGLSDSEYRAQMSMWAVLNAPLIAGNDVRSMTPETRQLLVDPDVLAVSRDWAGVHGHKVGERAGVEVWARPMSTVGSSSS